MSDFFIDPDRIHFEAFKALPRDEPRPPPSPTRRAASARYGEESGPIFRRVGGSVVWSAAYQTMLIGPSDKQWDRIFVARYPSAAAFLEMVTDPDYQKAVPNRTAALVTSRLMRTKPDLSLNGTFG